MIILVPRWMIDMKRLVVGLAIGIHWLYIGRHWLYVGHNYLVVCWLQVITIKNPDNRTVCWSYRNITCNKRARLFIDLVVGSSIFRRIK